MSLTLPERDQLPAGLVASRLPLDRVLYEAEAPVVFVTRTEHGQRLLAYVADEKAEGVITLLAPASGRVISALERGTIGIREALTASWMWMHLEGAGRSGLWAVNPEEIPALYLPLPDTPLHLKHYPVLRTRAIGQDVALGSMPASVIAFVAEHTRKALKTLLDFALDFRTGGRPSAERRTLYDLPIQRVAFRSFELSFGPPDEGFIPHDHIPEVSRRLRAGLGWAGELSGSSLPDSVEGERTAVLQAALSLTPPSHGPIEMVQVSGSWIGEQPISLTRSSRRRVLRELRLSEESIEIIGRIGLGGHLKSGH